MGQQAAQWSGPAEEENVESTPEPEKSVENEEKKEEE